MGALALADSKTLAALPEVSISYSVHIRGCGANVQSHVWASSNWTEKGHCTFDLLQAKSLWNWDKVGMRTWRWGQPASTAFYQWWELRQDDVTSPSLRKQSRFGAIRHKVQLSVKDMPGLHATGFWIFFFPMSEEHWKTFCTGRRKAPEF